MRILFVSMPSVQVIRWISNLKGSGHELYWFDNLDRGRFKLLDKVMGWRKRRLPRIKCEYYLQRKVPVLFESIRPALKITTQQAFESILRELNKVRRSKALQRIEYLITDCHRDLAVARQLGFASEHLGGIPGGGGFDLEAVSALRVEHGQRKLILEQMVKQQIRDAYKTVLA